MEKCLSLSYPHHLSQMGELALPELRRTGEVTQHLTGTQESRSCTSPGQLRRVDAVGDRAGTILRV